MARLLSVWLLSVCCATVLAQEPASNWNDENLVAWCIVPFDKLERSPSERAKMLSRLGLKRVAYDWREKHVPTFEEEIQQYRKHGIEYFAFWDVHEDAFRLFEKYDMHPQIWRMLRQTPQGTQSERVQAAVQELLPLVERTRAMGSSLGIYNHGGWAGEPENLVAICRALREQHSASHVGIVYNLHHAHDATERFAEALELMKPYLLCLNLNGMIKHGDRQDKKILPLGAGDLDLDLLKTIHSSKYSGPLGIIGHTQDDVEQRLQDNLDGLHWLLPQIRGQAPARRPKYRTYSMQSSD